MKQKRKSVRGITLIALVVTIVVLLILAGVSISMLTGENGIIRQAQKAKTETELSEIEEAANMIYVDLSIGSNGTIKDVTENLEDGYEEGLTGKKVERSNEREFEVVEVPTKKQQKSNRIWYCLLTMEW